MARSQDLHVGSDPGERGGEPRARGHEETVVVGRWTRRRPSGQNVAWCTPSAQRAPTAERPRRPGRGRGARGPASVPSRRSGPARGRRARRRRGPGRRRCRPGTTTTGSPRPPGSPAPAPRGATTAPGAVVTRGQDLHQDAGHLEPVAGSASSTWRAPSPRTTAPPPRGTTRVEPGSRSRSEGTWRWSPCRCETSTRSARAASAVGVGACRRRWASRSVSTGSVSTRTPSCSTVTVECPHQVTASGPSAPARGGSACSDGPLGGVGAQPRETSVPSVATGSGSSEGPPGARPGAAGARSPSSSSRRTRPGGPRRR